MATYTTGVQQVKGYKKPPRQDTWTTRFGNRIKLNKLEDEHLTNILRFLIRNVRNKYKNGIIKGEDWRVGLPNIYDDLQLEAFRRDLITKEDIIATPHFHYNTTYTDVYADINQKHAV